MSWEELFEWWKTPKKNKKKLKKEKRRHFFLVSSSPSSSSEDEEENVVDVKLQLFFCCVSMPTLINHYVYPSLSSWDEPVISIRLSVRPSAHLKNALDFPVVFVDKTSAFSIMANSSWYVVGITKDNVNSSSLGSVLRGNLCLFVCVFCSLRYLKIFAAV